MIREFVKKQDEINEKAMKSDASKKDVCKGLLMAMAEGAIEGFAITGVVCTVMNIIVLKKLK